MLVQAVSLSLSSLPVVVGGSFPLLNPLCCWPPFDWVLGYWVGCLFWIRLPTLFFCTASDGSFRAGSEMWRVSRVSEANLFLIEFTVSLATSWFLAIVS
eukprot:gnl/Chilomastix_caulleri/6346.p1 GENE.gnl/Chilomastix_caulleri/6346~~gnl/Chilomastix_caulleri/6346.p1  ORF type:complete len:99 (+),score=12.55 gnl/Chilomastix_caulleri/6346:134-430(+)